ncbi:hypothetical protein HBI56_189770 [Parastagonospora nodorum]|uniref:Uncharacterized protein n=2 Tax=Phaeosphaeria nodorum (strain SN15 / ATCC MYA-4574 / FGSC 10173) TaxID=321614 RepID=A0A7U2FBW4_PHANO|nr:hypothetical protein HBH56_144690 [Parastagonospora nodorum]QRD01389.1 hypothetical protein JI435_120590 [Parastagonospora nodorum SN15]KAH3927518.1 hypothetical protein HBH54_149880 [Parastagonospora nodorum]KAH3947991.1 hypothetical protein HBH53_109920 [Parastagonospora nodorum]KAH3960145.1 hypothetical protein HBH51_193740 [Parastagonospora nodorum]
MHRDYFAQYASFLSLTLSHFADAKPLEVHHANHVFNAIHSSMRQWGGSLNHNGMSFFLATVPANTQLYHGTWEPEAIQGMEWLAFEPEHARIFAQPWMRPPPPDDDYRTRHRERQSCEWPHVRGDRMTGRFDMRTSHERQQVLTSGDSKPNPNAGYLHTYTPKHDLRLLYVDGLSAAKTSNGTLDTQDMLLLNLTSSPGHMKGELARAYGMCNLTTSIWDGKIDGILRMEGGFEIILCEFEKHLKLADVMAVTSHRGQQGFLGGWSYLEAITSRYHGIGGDRVTLNYDSFISVFAYPDIDDLFDNDVHSDYDMPRLQNVEVSDLLRVRSDLTSMILRDDDRITRNWQAVADMVVARYSKPLHYLHTDKQIRLDEKALAEFLELLMSPFIDYTERNSTSEVRRCVAQVILVQTATSLAHRTIHEITDHICSTLFEALSAVCSDQEGTSNTSHDPAHAIEIIDNLYDYLQWTTWKDCGTCPDEQICYIPIWPMGTHEDHAQPRCRTEDEAQDRWGYWGPIP